MRDSGGGLLLGWAGHGLSGPAARQVPPVDELVIIDRPVRTKVVFIPHETLVEGEIGADRVLAGQWE